ncbi:MAG: aquaporin [Candidatus Peribacteraceae bacterium]|nr:aquaporin [Candidatus Peribacteraceae bacterium]MDD5742194.1 aquaporin [Candidatus Peribacteraceae bacterium]
MALSPLHWRKYVAELLGTATLTFAVLGSIQQQTATPFVAALVLLLAVYMLGPVSGAHVNPAVTVGLWSIKKIKTPEALAYIAAQLVGAVAAQFLFQYLVGGLPQVTVVPGWGIAFAEALGAFFLLLGIMAVVTGKVHSAASGLVIGCSLLLGILLASLMSNGILNPAVAIGIRSLAFSSSYPFITGLEYLIGPFIGAVAAVYLYQWMARE